MRAAAPKLTEIEQGSPEWHSLRKTKITATDASILMGVNPWKTRTQLYYEKLSNEAPEPANDRMQRGIDLEPVARELYNIQTWSDMKPVVIVKDWQMASLDGHDAKSNRIVEIKCPGDKDHAIALQGRVPEHYYPQLQHQMYVADVPEMDYFSFDGIDGVIVKVKRNDEYIEKMIEEEKKFYSCLMSRTPPEPVEGDYMQRDDDLWKECATKWRFLTDSIKDLEREEEEVRKRLIFLSGESNTKGAGISLCQIQRKGNIDYSKVPQLKGVDLEPYRKGSSISWRITCA